MAEKIAFENGRISNFEGLVTLTFDRVIMHNSSNSTYMPNFIEMEKTFLWKDGHKDGQTFETTLLGRLRREWLRV